MPLGNSDVLRPRMRKNGGDPQGVRIRGRLVSGKPNPVDIYVGSRVRRQRVILGMTQESLGLALGLTLQQIHKYESGENRICASRLWGLSGILGCTVSFFFEDMDILTADSSPRKLASLTLDTTALGNQNDIVPESLEFVRTYYRIHDPRLRRRIYDLVHTLAAAQELLRE
jgi:transcriptional regulator with XRE-family HTH domain